MAHEKRFYVSIHFVSRVERGEREEVSRKRSNLEWMLSRQKKFHGRVSS